jgi:Zn-dependent protease with chaperone function
MGVVIVIGAAVRMVVVGIGNSGVGRARAGDTWPFSESPPEPRDETPPPCGWRTTAHLAFSLAGRPGAVVATEGLTRHLPDASVTAVLEHERAYLRGRHHLLIAIVDTASAVLSVVPLFRRASVAIRELVEITADVVAVRACGAVAVQTALLGMAQHDTPSPALAMGNDAIDTRVARLRGVTPVLGRTQRTVSCVAAALLAATAPFLVAASLLFAFAMATCHLTGP